MNYLRFTLVLLFIIGAAALVWNYTKRLKKDYLRRIIEKLILQVRNQASGNPPYSSETVIKTAAWAAALPIRRQNEFIRTVMGKNITPVISFLNKNNRKDLAQELKSITGRSRKKILYGNEKAQLAARLLHEARENLAEGDLLTASEKTSQAAKIFNKLNYIFEEAEAYLQMGTIYRVSAVYDVADFMLRTARKIFAYLGARPKEAEALGTLGMLMTAQKRFDEAFAFFEQAEILCAENGQVTGQAEIINQKALSHLLQGNLKKAKKESTRAFKEHAGQDNVQGQAFSLEISAYISRAENNFNAVYKTAGRAARLHKDCGNRPAHLDMLFLRAEALFENGDYTKAEKILRGLIKEDQKCRSCFQVANSYNLLGLIYLMQHDLARAKTLFAQSLNCEIKNERTLGALIDYANMANVESKSGNAGQACKYLNLAIDFARNLEEDELLEILESRLTQNQEAEKSQDNSALSAH